MPQDLTEAELKQMTDSLERLKQRRAAGETLTDPENGAVDADERRRLYRAWADARIAQSPPSRAEMVDLFTGGLLEAEEAGFRRGYEAAAMAATKREVQRIQDALGLPGEHMTVASTSKLTPEDFRKAVGDDPDVVMCIIRGQKGLEPGTIEHHPKCNGMCVQLVNFSERVERKY